MRLAVLLLVPLLAAADRPETPPVPEGCRDGITLFCADPSWPDPDAAPRPARELTARVGPPGAARDAEAPPP